jgi:prephenate dehydratase
MTCIAFQGEPGAFSQELIFQIFGADTPTLPCHTFLDLFRAVAVGSADLGMGPIESLTAGSINQSYDLLLDYDLKITREAILRVRHALLAHTGVIESEIRRVYSHPSALTQCEKFIAARGWEPVAAYDTAGAAKQLAASCGANAAAIASETAARIYQLQILMREIQDLANNFTRFFIISKQEVPRAANAKTSTLFATRHIPGALHRCLGEFAARGINLAKLESRPDRKHPWHYIFYLDFEGHRDAAPCRDALAGMCDKTDFLRVLGSYPAATMPDEDRDRRPLTTDYVRSAVIRRWSYF